MSESYDRGVISRTYAYEMIDALRQEKDQVYTERNRLVALLTVIYPASLVIHEDKPDECWNPEWRTTVNIDFPWGQARWHVHESQTYLFDHLKVSNVPWDGTTTEEKYPAIEAAVRGD